MAHRANLPPARNETPAEGFDGKRGRPAAKKKRKPKDRRQVMITNARVRAKAENLPFTITKDDIIIPSHCPILGIPIFVRVGRQGGGEHSPSLDRIEPTRGYVPGNVIVISNRANRLKSDASIEELRSIASFYATFDRNVRVTGASQ